MPEPIQQIRAKDVKEFYKFALCPGFNQGTLLSCLDRHPMVEDSKVPEAFNLALLLSLRSGKPCWMIRGPYSINSETGPERFGTIVVYREGQYGRHPVPIPVDAYYFEGKKLLSIALSQKQGPALDELVNLTENITAKYVSRDFFYVQDDSKFDALCIMPTGEVICMSIQDKKIVEGPIHAVTYKKREGTEYIIEQVNKPFAMSTS